MVEIQEITDSDEQKLEDDESDAADIDFTAPTPNHMLPPFPHIKMVDDEDSQGTGEESGDEEQDFFASDNSKSHKNENLGSKRILLVIMLFPMLVSGFFMLSDAFTNITFPKSLTKVLGSVGLLLVPLFMYKLPAIRGAIVTVLMCLAGVILILPTYQVYKCSPVELKNNMIGTWFSLKTDALKFQEKSLTASKCFKNPYTQAAFYAYSLKKLQVNMRADVDELVELDSKLSNERAVYFMLTSKRSVKKKYHKLHLIVETPKDLATKLKTAIEWSTGMKDKTLLLLNGNIESLDQQSQLLKEELDVKYLVRPIVFKVHSVVYIDRYVKLKQHNTYQ